MHNETLYKNILVLIVVFYWLFVICNRHWHTTNAICWFSFEILETLTCLFTKLKICCHIERDSLQRAGGRQFANRHVDMCQCLMQNTWEGLKLRCDERFTHAFTACSCVFKVITLIWGNQGNYFENGTACSKRMRKTLVATQLKRLKVLQILRIEAYQLSLSRAILAIGWGASGAVSASLGSSSSHQDC